MGFLHHGIWLWHSCSWFFLDIWTVHFLPIISWISCGQFGHQHLVKNGILFGLSAMGFPHFLLNSPWIHSFPLTLLFGHHFANNRIFSQFPFSYFSAHSFNLRLSWPGQVMPSQESPMVIGCWPPSSKNAIWFAVDVSCCVDCVTHGFWNYAALFLRNNLINLQNKINGVFEWRL